MDAALGERAFAHREGDVGTLSREPRAQRDATKRLALCFQRLADAILQLIDGLPEALALFRRHAPERLHQLGDAALLAERSDSHIFQRYEVCSLGDRGKQLALDPLERSGLSRGRLGHASLKLKPWPQPTRPVWPSAATRTSSSAMRSAALAIAASSSPSIPSSEAV